MHRKAATSGREDPRSTRIGRPRNRTPIVTGGPGDCHKRLVGSRVREKNKKNAMPGRENVTRASVPRGPIPWGLTFSLRVTTDGKMEKGPPPDSGHGRFSSRSAWSSVIRRSFGAQAALRLGLSPGISEPTGERNRKHEAPASRLASGQSTRLRFVLVLNVRCAANLSRQIVQQLAKLGNLLVQIG
jgi:hypothetical protein